MIRSTVNSEQRASDAASVSASSVTKGETMPDTIVNGSFENDHDGLRSFAEDPAEQLWEACCKANADFNAAASVDDDWDKPHIQQLQRAMEKADQALMAHETTTLAGILCKLEFIADQEIEADAVDQVGFTINGLIRDLAAKLAREPRHTPRRRNGDANEEGRPIALAESGSPSREDDCVLIAASAWQRARAQALLVWATSNEKDRFGTVGEQVQCPQKALEEIDRYITFLGKLEPRTVRGGREMLNVVLEVLAHREIDSNLETSRLANLPILPIVRNVRNAMEFNCDAKLGSSNK